MNDVTITNCSTFSFSQPPSLAPGQPPPSPKYTAKIGYTDASGKHTITLQSMVWLSIAAAKDNAATLTATYTTSTVQ